MSRFITFICACFVLLTLVSTKPLHAQTITTFEKVVDYQLPYPGLLPDNPLYVLKQARDTVQLMMAGSSLEKAKVYLQIADKNMAAAIELTKKGKHKLAVERVQRAEAKYMDAFNLIEKPKDEINQEDRKAFIDMLRKANLKYREIIESLMKTTPTGQVEQLEELRQSNLEIQQKVEKLQK